MAEFTEMVKSNLADSMQKVFDNGCILLEDANILFEANRIARAGSLAILAIEEFSKALIIRLAIQSQEWNKEYLKLFRSHAKKQAIILGAFECVEYLLKTCAMNKNRICQIPYDYNRSFSELTSAAKEKHVERKELDNMKQNMQFTDIDITGACRCTPSNIEYGEICRLLDKAQKCKISTNSAIFSINADGSPLFRPHTTLHWDSSGVTKIQHKDGFDITIDPWALIKRNGPICLLSKEEVTMFYEFVERGFLSIGKPTQSDTDLIRKAQKIISDYSILSQVDTQLIWLDIKSSTFVASLHRIASFHHIMATDEETTTAETTV